MRHILSFIFSLLLISVSMSAQTKQTVVSGSVADKEGVALAGSTVLFLHSDTIAGGTVTDSKGKFELKGLPAGEYECRVSMIGFKSEIRKFSLTGKVKLPQFVLEEDATALDEVTVSAGMRSKELAGMSIYYLSDRAKKESNAYYALQEIPRLLINPIERKIRLDNGSSPLILVNGVKKPLDVLSPEMIESVEVIDNPSARYRGDAVNSVLNIKLKKNGIRPYFRSNLSGQLTPNVKSISIDGSLEIGNAISSFYINSGYFISRKTINEILSDINQGSIHREEKGVSIGKDKNPYIQIGGDKNFSQRGYFAFGMKYFANPTSSRMDTKGLITYLSQLKPSSLTSKADNTGHYHQLVGNIYYKLSFKKNRTIEISGDYFFTQSRNATDREEICDLYSYVNAIDLENNRHMGKLDINFSDVLNKSIHLDVGSNTEYSVTNIDDRLDALPVFKYQRIREYIYAGIDNNSSSNSKFNYVMSLGIDMVFSNAVGERHSYIDFIPSVSFRYKFNRKNSISLQYIRERSMPSAGELNPINTSTDSLQINVGNPLLIPGHNDKVSLGYIFSNGRFRLNPYIQYSYISDIIQPYGYLEDNIYVNTYQNIGHISRLQTGSTLSYSIPQGKSYYGNITANVYFQKSYIKAMLSSGNTFAASINGFLGFKKISISGYLGIEPLVNYSIYGKKKNRPYSNLSFSWRVGTYWQLSLFAENFLWPRMHTETWTINGDYKSFISLVQTSLRPKFCMRIMYTFATKNFKWRNKKQFYTSDKELDSVITK